MIGEDFCWLFLCGTDSGEIFTTCYGWDLLIDLFVVVGACSIINGSFLWNMIDSTVIIITTTTTAVTTTMEEHTDIVEHDHNNDALMNLMNTFFTFSLLYFCLINSWFWYVHQYSSRFVVASSSFRVSTVLLTTYLIGMIISSLVPSIRYDESSTTSKGHIENGLLYLHVRNFSLAMIIERIALFAMFISVAIPLPRTRPLCALLCFVLGNAILCFTFAAIDIQVASQLWFVVAIMEVFVDSFLVIALHNARRLWIPYKLQWTMNRSCVLAFAPLGATIISLFTTTNMASYNNHLGGFSSQSLVASDSLLLILSSLLLQCLFAFLYYHLQTEAVNHILGTNNNNQNNNNQHQDTPINRLKHAILLLIAKFLGWSLWLVGASLVGLILHPLATTTTSVPSSSGSGKMTSTDFLLLLLGWSVGCSMILLFCLRLLAGRMYDLREVAWLLACWMPFLVVFIEYDLLSILESSPSTSKTTTSSSSTGGVRNSHTSTKVNSNDTSSSSSILDAYSYYNYSNDNDEEYEQERNLNRQLISISMHLLIVALINVMESYSSLLSLVTSTTIDPIVAAAVATTTTNAMPTSLIRNNIPIPYSEREELINNQTSTIIYI